MSTVPPKNEVGVLYVVATPLGNLKDITLRALEILQSVDLIAAEDTRTTLKLLNHFELKGPKLVAYHEHNEKERTPSLIKALKEGKKIALVSEAGTPGISDPGAVLVRRAHEEGLPVVPVPGPSALACALSVSGFPLDEGFVFLGFLPAKRAKRRAVFQEVAKERRPLVFFEGPHRIEGTLGDALEILGDREVFLAREMTKKHEEYLLTRLSALYERFSQEKPRGEFTLVLAGASKGPRTPSEKDIAEALKAAFNHGTSLKEAVQKVSQETGAPKKLVYQLALKLRDSL
ncbi:MAG: 16S rRNA (cytidine(1402)-2'-O)-methyltransferase [Thermodesulfobacteria bacterium]|nr:16S rRNA (cytidine(1402)-2'-O)-methyltransferase [Thermodesulfobacteriota bacterium]